MSNSISYSDAGVSIDNANLAVAKIRDLAKATFNERTLTDIGSFGGMFSAAFPGMAEPVLVASADGVGTKLKIAFMSGIHNTVGQDLVNHCVNDILVQGARPLFFMDYFACGVVEPDVTAAVVEGMATGCKQNGCVLLGGETAEMPGFYADGEYDVAGFIVGVVDKQKVIDGRGIKAGDSVLALPANGLHTNGYSLARKLLFEVGGHRVDTVLEGMNETLGEILLKPHRSYLKDLDALLDSGKIKGLAHITGGGLLENIPRILPDNVSVEIKRGTWRELPIYGVMGVGMVIICAEEDKAAICESLGEECKEIGHVVKGEKEVKIN
jgi:phosphoribosylformylglycinamidine cyclo-ligase